MAAAQGAMAGQAMAAAAAGGATAAQDPVARLERLAALHEKGLLTDAELQAQKAKILGEL
jgi:membrane protease subunit (stomatin/prohibitin family)